MSTLVSVETAGNVKHEQGLEFQKKSLVNEVRVESACAFRPRRGRFTVKKEGTEWNIIPRVTMGSDCNILGHAISLPIVMAFTCCWCHPPAVTYIRDFQPSPIQLQARSNNAFTERIRYWEGQKPTNTGSQKYSHGIPPRRGFERYSSGI